MLTTRQSRPWHAVWPAHVPFSIDYPREPASWILERNLSRHAERTAIRYFDHQNGTELVRLSYAELHCTAGALAVGLQRIGVRGGDRVALFLPNSPELIAGYYGIWMAGGVAVPCNPLCKEAELAAQVADSGATVLMCHARTASIAGRVAEAAGARLIVVTRGADDAALPTGSLRFEHLPAESAPRPPNTGGCEPPSIGGPGGINPQDLAVLLGAGLADPQETLDAFDAGWRTSTAPDPDYEVVSLKDGSRSAVPRREVGA